MAAATRHTELVLRVYRTKIDLIRRYKAKVGCACGEHRAACLDLHHRDPSTKNPRMYVSRKSTTRWHDLSWSDIVAEIRKCDVLCSNCHRALHAKPVIPMQERVSPKLAHAEKELGLT